MLAPRYLGHIPALKNQTVGLERVPVEREMTIQDLMRHTSGLTYGSRGKTEIYKMYPESSTVSSLTRTMDEFIAQLSRAPLLYQPGTRWEYGLSTDVLGRVVEIVAGKPLGEVLSERIYPPPKMTDTTFLVPANKGARIAQGLVTPGASAISTGRAPSRPTGGPIRRRSWRSSS